MQTRVFQFCPATAPLSPGSGAGLEGHLIFMAFSQNLMGLEILQSCACFDLPAMLFATSNNLQVSVQLCNDRWMNHHFSGRQMLHSWDMALGKSLLHHLLTSRAVGLFPSRFLRIPLLLPYFHHPVDRHLSV